jgi:hypothetical protein
MDERRKRGGDESGAPDKGQPASSALTPGEVSEATTPARKLPNSGQAAPTTNSAAPVRRR